MRSSNRKDFSPRKSMLRGMEEPLKILNVFLGSRARRGWPSPEYDYEMRAEELAKFLEDLKKSLKFPVVYENRVASSMEDVGRLEREIGDDVDAVFAYILTSESTRFTYWAAKKIADLGYDYIHKYGGYGIPTVYVIDLYGGDISALPLIEDLVKAGRRFLMVSSSKDEDLVRAIRCVYAVKMLRKSRVLLITRREANPAKYLNPSYMERIREVFGVDVEYVDYGDVKRLYDEVDAGESERVAESLIRGAREVREPSRGEVVEAARMYLALKKLLEERGANALAIDCLGWLEYGEIPMPMTPCVALSLLNSEGYVAACEADMHSALTMLVFRYLADAPSFISDPVVDTGKNTVIHCHCTAPIKMDGESEAPYILRSHADSAGGVSLQVLMREGERVSVGKFIEGLEEFLVATGEVVGNVDVDRGCRTKVEVTVKDSEKYLYGYRGGLHRVLVYGDHVKALRDLGRLLGFRVVMEGE